MMTEPTFDWPNSLTTKSILLALWLLLTSASLLLMPLSSLKSIQMHDWAEQNAYLLGLTLVCSCCYIIAQGSFWQWQQWLNRQEERNLRKKTKHKIAVFDSSERAILREFFLQGKTQLPMPLTNNTVAELIHYGVLQQTGPAEEYAIEGAVAEFKISADARHHLNRKLLRIPEGKPTDAQRQRLVASRPEFARKLTGNRRKAA